MSPRKLIGTTVLGVALTLALSAAVALAGNSYKNKGSVSLTLPTAAYYTPGQNVLVPFQWVNTTTANEACSFTVWPSGLPSGTVTVFANSSTGASTFSTPVPAGKRPQLTVTASCNGKALPTKYIALYRA